MRVKVASVVYLPTAGCRPGYINVIYSSSTVTRQHGTDLKGAMTFKKNDLVVESNQSTFLDNKYFKTFQDERAYIS